MLQWDEKTPFYHPGVDKRDEVHWQTSKAHHPEEDCWLKRHTSPRTCSQRPRIEGERTWADTVGCFSILVYSSCSQSASGQCPDEDGPHCLDPKLPDLVNRLKTRRGCTWSASEAGTSMAETSTVPSQNSSKVLRVPGRHRYAASKFRTRKANKR